MLIEAMQAARPSLKGF